MAATNPGLVYLRTGRRAVMAANLATNIEAWRAAGIRFVVALQPTALPPAAWGVRPLYQSNRLWIAELTFPDNGS